MKSKSILLLVSQGIPKHKQKQGYQVRSARVKAIIVYRIDQNMSLQRIAPRLILSSCNNINRCNKTIINSSIYNPKRIPTSSVVRRGFSTPSTTTKKDATKLTAEEVEAALEKANESMKAYYSYPPEKVIAAKKARFDRRHRDKQFYLQLGIGEYTSVQYAL